MVDALNRISTAADEGVLDRTAGFSNTMNARNLFIGNASKVFHISVELGEMYYVADWMKEVQTVNL